VLAGADRPGVVRLVLWQPDTSALAERIMTERIMAERRR